MGQLREIVGLSLETYRHWKRVFPGFAGRSGRAASFSAGDLLAACILRQLTEVGGIRTGQLRDVASDLLRICNTPWGSLEGGVLAIGLKDRSCRVVRAPWDWREAGFAVVCPLDPMLNELRGVLLGARPETGQDELILPPVGLRSKAAGRRSG
jgi:hypothetical protein